jgi:hypothetical protein
MSESQSLEAVTAKRHADVLPASEYRREYAEMMAEALDAIARAAQDIADSLRNDPNKMLAQAFDPTITGMDPSATAAFEVSYAALNGVPRVMLKGKGKIVQSEIGFRLFWKDGVVMVARANSFGG